VEIAIGENSPLEDCPVFSLSRTSNIHEWQERAGQIEKTLIGALFCP
jgi:hypothetical protein